MAINDVAQTIAEARVDARSLSEFVFKPAGFKVARRLAPPIDTLQFYIGRFDDIAENGAAQITQAIINSGFVTIDSFELGANITQRNQALRHAETGKLYRWAGDLPKTVPTSSTPASSGGFGANAWLEVGDVALRQDLMLSPENGAGATLVKGSTVQFDNIIDAKKSTRGRLGQTVVLNGRVSAGDGGYAIWEYVSAATNTANSYTIVTTNSSGLLLKIHPQQEVSVVAAGAKADGEFDNKEPLQQVVKTYKKVYIPSGVFYTSGDISPMANSIIRFDGWLKSLGGENATLRLVTVGRPNVTLINPLLDGNIENIENFTYGTFSCIACYSYGSDAGDNLRIINGYIKSGVSNLLQGGRNNMHVSGTVFDGAGEHLLYINGIQESKPLGKNTGSYVFENCTFRNAGIQADRFDEGNYVQARNCGIISFKGCKWESDIAVVSEVYGGILCTNVDNLIVDGCEMKDVTSSCIYFGANMNPDSVGFTGEGNKGKLTINSSSFYNSFSTKAAMTILKTNGNSISAVIKDCYFSGGAFNQEIPDVLDKLDVIDCVFDNLKYYISLNNTNIDFTRCKFIPHSSYSNTLINNIGRTLSLTDCRFPKATANTVVTAGEGVTYAYDNRFLEDTVTSLLHTGTGTLVASGNIMPKGATGISIKSENVSRLIANNNYIPLGGILTNTDLSKSHLNGNIIKYFQNVLVNNIKQGTTATIPPSTVLRAGDTYFNKTDNSYSVWDGTAWVGFNSSSYGATSARPTKASVGYQYFDTTINKPVFYTGTSWVDSTGVAA